MSDHMNMGIMTTRIGRAICQKLEGNGKKDARGRVCGHGHTIRRNL